MIERTGRGRFTVGPGVAFNPPITPSLKRLSAKIKTTFPYITYCVWETDMVRSFQQHLPGAKFILIDVEKDSTQAVFDYLHDRSDHVWLKPDNKTMDRYILSGNIGPRRENLVVRQLITEAPIQTCFAVPTVTLEKMLADLFADGEFGYLQGQELLVVFQNAWDRYSINTSKLLRYAARKGQRQEIQEFLETNNFAKKNLTRRDLEEHP